MNGKAPAEGTGRLARRESPRQVSLSGRPVLSDTMVRLILKHA